MFRRQAVCLGVLGAASLLFESTMTRLLAVTQFYHFAFLVVSLALLGYGASGTLLAVVPALRRVAIESVLSWSGLGFAMAVGLAYGVINFLPFDSYAIAWDSRQLLYFGVYYLVLSLPFLASGVAVGAAIAGMSGKSHLVYAANLLGSGLGALVALPVLELAGVPGAVLLSGLLVLGMVLSLRSWQDHAARWFWLVRFPLSAVTLVGLVILVFLVHSNQASRSPLGLTLSPYKGLAQAWRVAKAETSFGRWNAISRVDVVRGAGTHQLPGLSYAYAGTIPSQAGLFLDGDANQAIPLVSVAEFDAADFMPESLAYRVKPGASVLVLEPGGGLGVLQALAGGAEQVVALISNPLEARAVRGTVPTWSAYDQPDVRTILASSRNYLAQTTERFDLVVVPLTGPFRPVTSGAYSLAETYDLTVEAAESALSRLSPHGILALTRWIQMPPSESLRAAAMLVEALSQTGKVDAGNALVMYRGIQTMTLLAKPDGWTPAELGQVRDFCRERKYDLVWLPGIQETETNRFNKLAEPVYHQAVKGLIESTDRGSFYATADFDIRPPRDDHPFFFHFFKWEQTSQVLAAYGHTWQPFGGSGYLVTFALLALTVVLSICLILLPLLWLRKPGVSGGTGVERWAFLAYYSLLGFGFLFIEIPLIQKTMLLLGHPTRAFTVVVSALLVFSGLGSAMARRPGNPTGGLMVGLLGITAILAAGYQPLVQAALGWPLLGRIGLVIACLMPAGFLMGLPFPLGLARLETTAPDLVPWVWGVNGSVSVVASVLAAILALGFRLSLVLWLGVGMYAGALGLLWFSGKFSNKDETHTQED